MSSEDLSIVGEAEEKAKIQEATATEETQETKKDKEVNEQPDDKAEAKAEAKVSQEEKKPRTVPISVLQKQRQEKRKALNEVKDLAQENQELKKQLDNAKTNAKAKGEELNVEEIVITDEEIQDAFDEGDTGKAKLLTKEQAKQKQNTESKKDPDTEKAGKDEQVNDALNDSGLSDYMFEKDKDGNDVFQNGKQKQSPVFKKVVELDKSESVVEGENLTDRYARLLDKALEGAVEPETDIHVPVGSPSKDMSVEQKESAGLELTSAEEDELFAAAAKQQTKQ